MQADVSAAPDARDLRETLEERMADLRMRLAESGMECDQDQAHLDAGRLERAYWHHGYLIALQDVYRLIGGPRRNLS